MLGEDVVCVTCKVYNRDANQCIWADKSQRDDGYTDFGIRHNVGKDDSPRSLCRTAPHTYQSSGNASSAKDQQRVVATNRFHLRDTNFAEQAHRLYKEDTPTHQHLRLQMREIAARSSKLLFALDNVCS